MAKKTNEEKNQTIEDEILKETGLDNQPEPKETLEDSVENGIVSEEPVEVATDDLDNQPEQKEEFYITDHTVKVNGVYYNTGDKVPKV